MTIIERELRELISEIIKPVSEEVIKLDENLINRGLDSMGFIQLIVNIENKFELELDSDDLIFEYFDTLQKIIEYVENQMNSQTELGVRNESV